MKFLTSLVIGITFMLSAQVIAEDSPGKRGPGVEKGDRKGPGAERGDRKGPKGKMRAKILKKFDADGNGTLDENEKAALKKAIQERRANGEGKGPKGKRKGPGKDGDKSPRPDNVSR